MWLRPGTSPGSSLSDLNNRIQMSLDPAQRETFWTVIFYIEAGRESLA